MRPELLSTFRLVGRTSVNFCALSVLTKNYQSTFVNFLCGRKTFHQLPSTFCAARRYPSTSVNFPCGWENFCQCPSTFRVSGRHFINFISILCGAVNFSELPMWLGDLPSTSINFPCGWKIYLNFPCEWHNTFNFRLHSVRLVDLPSTSVNIPWHWENFCQLRSTFRAAG